MSRVEVNIMGQSYVLASPDGEAQLLVEAAQRVDEAMCSIRDAGKIKARDRIAVLAGLNLAFDLLKQPTQTVGVSSVPASVSANSSASSVEADAQLRAILDKLDRALSNDGQLI